MIAILVSSFNLFAQSISMGSAPAALYTCGTDVSFLDSGGSTGDYAAGEISQIIICPSVGFVSFVFDSANFSHAGDFLAFYDGINTTQDSLLLDLYNQSSIPAPGSLVRPTINNASGCITVQFSSDAASAGGNFSFGISCDNTPCKSIIAEFPGSSIPVLAGDVGYINSCSSDSVFFTANATYDDSNLYYEQDDATSTFYWDFGLLGQDTGKVIGKSFPTGIFPVSLTIVDVEGCKNTNPIDLKVRRAFDPTINFIPEDTTLCLNDVFEVAPFLVTSVGNIILIGDTLGIDTLKLVNEVSIVDTVFLPDDSDGSSGNGVTTPAFYEFPISGYQLGSTMQNPSDLIEICLDIEHSFVGDLDIVLECPNGQSVSLVDMTPPGTPGWDFGEEATSGLGVPYTYCWSPSGDVNNIIADGNTTVIGNLLGNGAIDTSAYFNITGNVWNSFIGCPLNGTWIVKVFDDYGGDDGNLFGASIKFSDIYAADSDTFLVTYDNPYWNSSNQIISDLNNDSITVKTVNPIFETLVLNFEDNLGCTHSEEYTINIDTFKINITPDDTTICVGDADVPIRLTAYEDGDEATCQYAIEMFDVSFFGSGDTWNGNTITIYVDNVSQGIFTIDATDADPEYSLEYFYAADGQEIKIQFNGGGLYDYENEYRILDPNGVELYENTNVSVGVNFTTTAVCNTENTYTWGPSISSTSESILVDAPESSDTYFVEAINANGCYSSDTTTIELILVPITLTEDQTICYGESVELTAGGGTAYQWSPTDSLNNSTSATVTASPIENTTYTVLYTLQGCYATDSVKVTVESLGDRLINNGLPVEFCEGLTKELYIDDLTGWTYSWSGPETGDEARITVSTEGSYTVTYTDGNCSNSSTVYVQQNDAPEFDFSGIDTILCCTDDQEEIVFADVVSNVGISEVYWNGDEAGSSEIVYSNENGNNARELNLLRVRSDKGCEAETELPYITTKCANPKFYNSDTVFFNTSEEFDLTVNETNSTTTSYSWTTTQANAIVDASAEDAEVQGLEEGFYTAGVTVTNSYDGKDETCTEVAEERDYEVVIIPDPLYPDAFTPKNGDDLNNVFKPVISRVAYIKEFRVYNRWGQLVYDMETADNKDGWDGTWNDIDQEAELYIYYMKVAHPDKDYTQEGTVTLLR